MEGCYFYEERPHQGLGKVTLGHPASKSAPKDAVAGSVAVVAPSIPITPGFVILPEWWLVIVRDMPLSCQTSALSRTRITAGWS